MRRLLAGCTTVVALLACTPLAAEEGNEQVARVGVASIGETAEGIAAASTEGGAVASPVLPGEPPGSIALGSSLAQWTPPPRPTTLVLNADLAAQRLTVIENGKVRASWPISSGRAGFATPRGTFRPQWMTPMWHSRQYEMAPMPHAIFFTGGVAFHGTSAVGLLGRPASHGCVRLHPGNAAQLFKLVSRHSIYQTKVVVHGGSKSREPAVAARPGKKSKQKAAAANARNRSPVAAQGEATRRKVARNAGRVSPYYGGLPSLWSD